MKVVMKDVSKVASMAVKMV